MNDKGLKAINAAYLCTGVLAAILCVPHPAYAQNDSPADDRIARLQKLVEVQALALQAQAAQLAAAKAQLTQQGQAINDQRQALVDLKTATNQDLAAIAARGTGPAPPPPADQPADPSSYQVSQNVVIAPSAPEPTVGEAPPPKTINAAVLPQGINILTAPGHLVAESSLNYVQTNNNLLVFRGVELVPGVEVGVIDANNTNRTQGVAIETLRYGLFPRFEIEALVPYVYGTDRVTEAAQRDEQVTQTTNLRGSGLGDVEFTGRYQITSGVDGSPIFVGNLRVKPPTGSGPFDLKYDQFGAALDLPTGSGFWGVEPSLSMLYTSDPAVIFASLGYLYNFGTTVNKTIGGAVVGKVDPGDSIDAAFGFAFSLNQRFSFSLGYRESYIRDTYEEINGTQQRSYALQVGSLLFGNSFRVTDRVTVSANFEFGVTSDAPDVTATFRVPIAF